MIKLQTDMSALEHAYEHTNNISEITQKNVNTLFSDYEEYKEELQNDLKQKFTDIRLQLQVLTGIDSSQLKADLNQLTNDIVDLNQVDTQIKASVKDLSLDFQDYKTSNQLQFDDINEQINHNKINIDVHESEIENIKQNGKEFKTQYLSDQDKINTYIEHFLAELNNIHTQIDNINTIDLADVITQTFNADLQQVKETIAQSVLNIEDLQSNLKINRINIDSNRLHLEELSNTVTDNKNEYLQQLEVINSIFTSINNTFNTIDKQLQNINTNINTKETEIKQIIDDFKTKEQSDIQFNTSLIVDNRNEYIELNRVKNEEINDINDHLSTHDDNISTIDNEIIDIHQALVDHDERIATNLTWNNKQNERLNTHQATLDRYQENITSLNQYANNINEKANENAIKIEDNNTLIRDNIDSIQQLQSTDIKTQRKLDDLNSVLDTHENQISLNADNILHITNDINQLYAKVQITDIEPEHIDKTLWINPTNFSIKVYDNNQWKAFLEKPVNTLSQQEIMQNFMHVLTTVSESDGIEGLNILNIALNEVSSNFKTFTELYNQLLVELQNSRLLPKTFLYKYAGINLDNDDTGSILGIDADGKDAFSSYISDEYGHYSGKHFSR